MLACVHSSHSRRVKRGRQAGRAAISAANSADAIRNRSVTMRTGSITGSSSCTATNTMPQRATQTVRPAPRPRARLGEEMVPAGVTSIVRRRRRPGRR